MTRVTIVVPGGSVETDLAAAMMSRVVAEGVQDDAPDRITLPYPIAPSTLDSVMEWCEYHAVVPAPVFNGLTERDGFERHFAGHEFDIFFFREVWDYENPRPFFDLVHAVNFLDIPPLDHLIVIFLSCFLRNKTPAEIVHALDLPEPTPEQKEAFWAEIVIRVPEI